MRPKRSQEEKCSKPVNDFKREIDKILQNTQDTYKHVILFKLNCKL